MFTIELARTRIFFTDIQDPLEAFNLVNSLLSAGEVIFFDPPQNANLCLLVRKLERWRRMHLCIPVTRDLNKYGNSLESQIGGACWSPDEVLSLDAMDRPAIVTGMNPLSFISSIKALGLDYPGADLDYRILSEGFKVNGSPFLRQLLLEMNALPAFAPAQPEIYEEQVRRIFTGFLRVVPLRSCIQKRRWPINRSFNFGWSTIRIDTGHAVVH